MIDLIREFGFWIVFAWLYIQEKKAHLETRAAYFDDLRDLAGVRSQLRASPQNLPETKD